MLLCVAPQGSNLIPSALKNSSQTLALVPPRLANSSADKAGKEAHRAHRTQKK